MTCRDREKNNFPFTDNTNEDCEGNYYSTQCIIVNGNEEYENQELNKFISSTLSKAEEMENLINILLNDSRWDKALEDYYDKEEVDLLLDDIDLSDYYTKTEIDDLLSNLPSGTPNLADVLSEGNSADNNRITNLSDGVDAGDAVNKSQLDALESPFEVIDVTQQAFSDIAINVKDFGNTQAGMTYQEGAIDFGVSRDNIHEMGPYSFKTGIETKALEPASTAFGNFTTASGGVSTAFGLETEASGFASSSFGSSTIASGTSSSAFGDFTEASGQTSTAFGNGAIASGGVSTAFGIDTKASGNYSSAFGYSTVANEFASFAIGHYSTDGVDETNWTDGSPIFKVGNGTSISNRKNAYTLYNDGRSEQEKDMEVTTIGQGFVLKSPDGTRWRITVDNDGSLTTTELN